jgi:hypothetical protein
MILRTTKDGDKYRQIWLLFISSETDDQNADVGAVALKLINYCKLYHKVRLLL